MKAANDGAKAEQKRLCANRPDSCQSTLKLDMKLSPEDPKAWSYEVMLPYSAFFEMEWGRVRQTFKRKWLGFEYYAEVVGPAAEQADRGEISDRDALLIAYKASEQAQEMLREQVQTEFRAARAVDSQAWQTAATMLLATAVAGMNAYTVANTQIRQPVASVPAVAPRVTTPTALSRQAPAAATNCTYGLWALGGKRLCAMTDGTVASPRGLMPYETRNEGNEV
jgi:hypothetical protein